VDKIIAQQKRYIKLINDSIYNVGKADIVIQRDAIHYKRFDNTAGAINTLSSAIKHGRRLLHAADVAMKKVQIGHA